MSRPGDFDYLLGTRVALSHPSAVHPQTFVLDEKLSEDYQTMSQEEYDEGTGHPYAAIKFTCHNVLNSAEQGFMRIYAQIPVNGTLHSAAELRAQQARSHGDHTEVEALVSFDEANCTAVPKLLGVSRIVQGPQDYVPGGYITSVAWARVPGEPVDVYAYWKASYEYRQEVRAAFRATFQ
ncbi:hypothetical protein PITC_077370 [Penicillium italicum]|uniref:Uncharacterized protein n=1 Tax=Penicillium italicum TaxID=40296 RepID=A0A0A2KPK7_PENIT|nr:hypothetical protein PITC_077370 [Penicillium italicum]